MAADLAFLSRQTDRETVSTRHAALTAEPLSDWSNEMPVRQRRRRRLFICDICQT